MVTRQGPGALDRRLVELGAEIIHLPLIATVDPADGGAALDAALDRLSEYSWLVVTSPVGANRVVAAGAVALRHPAVKVAAVGLATAAVVERVIGRPVELVPTVQRLDGLLSEFPQRVPGDDGPDRVLAARADRADPALVAGLERLGWRVDDVVAYRTVTRQPDDAERERVAAADAVLFASGSAVQSWVDAFGTGVDFEGTSPRPAVVVIGPSTAAVAGDLGLAVTTVATHQSLDGLVDALLATLRSDV